MKKRFNMIDIDCANCAAKMEAEIKKLDGVEDATISFMAQKLTLVADEADFERLLPEIRTIIKKIEPDTDIEF